VEVLQLCAPEGDGGSTASPRRSTLCITQVAPESHRCCRAGVGDTSPLNIRLHAGFGCPPFCLALLAMLFDDAAMGVTASICPSDFCLLTTASRPPRLRPQQIKCSGSMPCERCVTFCLKCEPPVAKLSSDSGGGTSEPYMDLALTMLDPRHLAEPMIQVGGSVVWVLRPRVCVCSCACLDPACAFLYVCGPL
jgi:hypothetical protein